MQRKKLKKLIISLIGYGYNKAEILAFKSVKKKEILSIIDDVRG